MSSHPTPSIPMSAGEVEKFSRLEAHLASEVIGQQVAVATLAKAIRAGEMGHTQRGAPKSFAFVVGPTGTGKTKAVLAASKYLFGTEAIARLNMAEFSTPDQLGSLLPTLCNELEKLVKVGGRFLLLDEIEKGHPRASDLFLGMEAAEISDPSSGRKFDLSDFHIFVTSNVGASDLSEIEEGVPFPTIKRVVEDAAKAQFRPEVFARFTHVVIYRKLTRDAQLKICQQMLEQELRHQCQVLAHKLAVPQHRIEIGDGVFRRMVSEGYHRELGARPMRNVVQLHVRDAVVNARLEKALVEGDTASRLELEGDRIVLRAIRPQITPKRLKLIPV